MRPYARPAVPYNIVTRAKTPPRSSPFSRHVLFRIIRRTHTRGKRFFFVLFFRRRFFFLVFFSSIPEIIPVFFSLSAAVHLSSPIGRRTSFRSAQQQPKIVTITRRFTRYILQETDIFPHFFFLYFPEVPHTDKNSYGIRE